MTTEDAKIRDRATSSQYSAGLVPDSHGGLKVPCRRLHIDSEGGKSSASAHLADLKCAKCEAQIAAFALGTEGTAGFHGNFNLRSVGQLSRNVENKVELGVTGAQKRLWKGDSVNCHLNRQRAVGKFGRGAVPVHVEFFRPRPRAADVQRGASGHPAESPFE